MKNSQGLEELQSLLKQAQIAEERLSNAQTELRVAQQRKSQLQAEVEAETKRLLVEREKELDSKLATRREALGRLQGEQETVRESIEKAKSQLLSFDEPIAAKRDELKELLDKLSVFEGKLQVAQTDLDGTQQVYKEANQAIETLRAETKPLEIRKATLEDEVQILSGRQATLKTLVSALDTTYNDKKTEKETEIAKYEAKLTRVKQEILTLRSEEETVRKELAARQMSADKREQVLSQRERKVLMDEGKIQQNANLLNL